MAIIISNLFN